MSPTAGTVLPVAQRIPAGGVGQPLAAGSAARIFTGAQIPAGADAVVMQEALRGAGGRRAGRGAHRRAARARAPGSAAAARTCSTAPRCLRRGKRLTPRPSGLAASVGAAQLQVARRPRVALLSTGDELVMPGRAA